MIKVSYNFNIAGEIKVVSLSDIKKGKLFTKDFSHMLSIDLNFSQ